jgi:diguanylate cyclase (GGDEF)-like protein
LNPSRRFRLGLALGILLALSIFVFNLVTPPGINGDLLYVGLVMIALYMRHATAAIVLAGVGTALILIEPFLLPEADFPQRVLMVNRALTIAAIWATAIVTYLHVQSIAELRPLADRDELTELYNRRYFNAEARRQISAWRRFRHPLSLIMLDIDHFKEINDIHGHNAGDQVLIRLATVLRSQARDIDTICRYGGEEFVILLPFTDLRGATAKAEQIRRAVAIQNVRWGGHSLRFKISLGVAELTNSAWDIETLVAAADQALYQAKRMGRDRVVVVREPK